MKPNLLLTLMFAVSSLHAQDVWFKFNKNFVQQHVNESTGFGSLSVSVSHPAGNVHSVSCGGQDGELHIGVLDVEVTDAGGQGVSGVPNQNDAKWGLVVEPVNLKGNDQNDISTVSQGQAEYAGFFRVWNEGHYKGVVYPSNPHHVLELHPNWSYRGSGIDSDRTASVHPMSGFAGYGATKVRPLLQSVAKDGWLQTYEDSNFVYINLRKADNFYQLPVTITSISDVDGGRQAIVDVYSDAAHRRRIYEGLTVNMLSDDFSNGLSESDKTFFLGIFSVNPRRALTLASGHGPNDPADASKALEFFSYGFPHEKAVKNSNCDH
jgi:hypothetical protein